MPVLRLLSTRSRTIRSSFFIVWSFEVGVAARASAAPPPAATTAARSSGRSQRARSGLT
jgi:hypothetical protein